MKRRRQSPAPGRTIGVAEFKTRCLALLDSVGAGGGELTISFLSETALVRVSPLTRVELQVPGSLADVVPGATLIGFVNDATGVAGVIWIYVS